MLFTRLFIPMPRIAQIVNSVFHNEKVEVNKCTGWLEVWMIANKRGMSASYCEKLGLRTGIPEWGIKAGDGANFSANVPRANQTASINITRESPIDPSIIRVNPKEAMKQYIIKFRLEPVPPRRIFNFIPSSSGNTLSQRRCAGNAAANCS
ncbi:hypothetical protein M1N44_01245 [Dehalococcoidia bacterium]|nr:hypothetical protein [Dehalococcoidia bacterium]